MLEGYEALRTRAAWLDLSDRGKIAVTGRDRVRLFHNLTTNHIKQLAPGTGCYAFLLSAQGRIQADLHLFVMEDRFLLDTEPELRERVPQHVRRYTIADQVTLEDVTGAFATLGVEGPGSAAVLASLGASVPESPWQHRVWEDATLARVSATGLEGFRLFVPAARKAEWTARLAAAGAVPASREAWRAARIEQGRPRWGEDIGDKQLPQETRQLQAIHFEKGCYLGQEIVERIRARGHVNRVLVKLEISGETPAEAGAHLRAGAEAVGEITSSAFSPALGQVVALGYVRVAHAAPGTRLDLDGREAVVARNTAC